MVVHQLPKLNIRVRFPSPAVFWIGAAVFCAGCTPYREPARLEGTGAQGSTHQVVRGETLWAIARRYGLPVDELARANRISDSSKLESGQTLVVPLRSPTGPPARSWGPDSGRFVWPVKGRVISIFGTRRRGTVNKGIDIQAPPGTEVVAARSGRVSFVHESLPGFGKTIIIEHENRFASVYAHVAEILVRQGDRVSQRQPIARVGDTGRAEVPALHFEIRQAQKPQNPLRYLP